MSEYTSHSAITGLDPVVAACSCVHINYLHIPNSNWFSMICLNISKLKLNSFALHLHLCVNSSYIKSLHVHTVPCSIYVKKKFSTHIWLPVVCSFYQSKMWFEKKGLSLLRFLTSDQWWKAGPLSVSIHSGHSLGNSPALRDPASYELPLHKLK